MKLLLSVLAAGVCHELGHLLCARILGVKVKRAGLTWRGLFIVREPGADLQNLAVTLAGPLANLLVVGVVMLTPWLGLWCVRFAFCNFLVAVVNLVPAPHSDGARVLSLLRRSNSAEEGNNRAA